MTKLECNKNWAFQNVVFLFSSKLTEIFNPLKCYWFCRFEF